MKEIYTAETVFELNIIKQFFEHHDIPAFIHGEHIRGYYAGLHFARPRLMVLEDDFDTAITLLKEHEDQF